MELTPELSTGPQAQAAAIEQPPAATSLAPPLKGDRVIWGIYLVLCLLSLVELYSASSQEVRADSNFGVYGPIMRHAMQLLLGFGLLMFIQRQSYTKFILWGPIIAIASFVMMVLVLFIGKDINGARRCLDLGVFTLYPSELIKMSDAMVIALVMARTNSKTKNEKQRWAGVWISAGATVLFGGILITQGLTNTILLMGIALSMLLVGGVKWAHLGKVIGIFSVAIVALAGILIVITVLTSTNEKKELTEVRVSPEEQKMFAAIDENKPKVEKKAEVDGILGRFSTWWGRLQRYGDNDEMPKYMQPINDLNRQEMYGYMAQAHGGITGVKPGNSRETARLPLAFSDYIFSIIVEEWGLIGGLMLLVVYLLLLTRASSIASRCNQRFAARLVIGMAVMIVLQARFHMAIVTGLFPVSGQPLPLISKGGTSILVTSVAFGVMLSVSRFGVRTGRKQDEKAETASLPDNFRSVNPTQL